MIRTRLFRRQLLDWYARGARDLPWRRTRDPYAIWISEIMLQQTRVQAVIPYYTRFLARFPTVEDLAATPEQDLLAAWAGLGYYSRARNLQKAARAVVDAGEFPDSYEGWRELPGVGDYTAAAVASIAFGRVNAVLDGNVARVLARLTAESGDVKAPEVRSRFRALAAGLLDPHDPGTFNQAIMELGAVICTPHNPACVECPVSGHCEARANGRQNEFPILRARPDRRRLEQKVYIVERRGRILLRQRLASERLMPGFWELPGNGNGTATHAVGSFRHSIVNHDYTFEVHVANIPRALKGHKWWPLERLHELPMTTTARKALACWQRYLFTSPKSSLR